MAPFDADDLVEAHGGRDRKLSDRCHWHGVARVGVERRKQLLEFLGGRTPFALF